MAAPHVAGVAALMKAIAPEMSPADFDALLAAGELTNDFGAPGRDNVYGHGLLDAYRAVLAAHMLANGTVPDLPPQPPLVQPPALIMNAQTAAAVVTVSEPATAVPAIAAVRASVPWLSAGPTMTDAFCGLTEAGSRALIFAVVYPWIGLPAFGAVVAAFALLYSRYRSLLFVAIIMGSVPLALIGSVIALWWAGQPLSVASMIGFITLMAQVFKAIDAKKNAKAAEAALLATAG